MTETFDGTRVKSVAQDIGFGRVRVDDASYVVLDLGDGQAVHRAGDELALADFTSPSEIDAAFVYDYRTHELKGPDSTAYFNNVFVRPLLDKAPALGADAQWELAIAPADIGMAGVSGSKATLRMSRRYFTSGSTSLVLVTYDVPSFAYETATGETVVHWGRGVVLADPSFGTIYWAASRQQAVARTADGMARPYRFSKNFIAAGLDGKPLIEVATIPEAAPMLQQMASTSVEIGDPGAAEPDQTPLTLAALIDMAAVAVGENSPNQALETAATFTVGKVDRTAGSVTAGTIGAVAANGGSGVDPKAGIVTAGVIGSGSVNARSPRTATTGPLVADSKAGVVTAGAIGLRNSVDQTNGTVTAGAIGGMDPRPGQAAKPTILESLIDSVNPYSPNFTPGTAPTFQSTGQQILGDKGGRAGANVDAAIGIYSTPDKLIAALNTIADRGPSLAQADVAAFVERWNKTAAEVTTRADTLNKEITALRNQYKKFYDTALMVRIDDAAAGIAFANGSNDSKVLKDYYAAVGKAIGVAKAAGAENQAMEILSRLNAAEDEMLRLTSLARAVEAYYPKLDSFLGYLRAHDMVDAIADFQTSTKAMRLQKVFEVAGGIGNVASVASAANALGSYDPSATGTRTFTNNYSSKGTVITTLGLNILGFAANAGSGKTLATAIDLTAWGSGYFTDLYIATQDVVHASETSQQATMDYALTVMRRGNQLDAKRLKDLADFTAQLGRVNTGLADLHAIFDQMARSKTIEPGNPHFDQKTGLPKAQYWAYLKANAPWKLREYGIDPDAPVGGWPAGARPDPTPPAPPVVDLPRQPDGPSYPVARKKPATAVNGAIVAENAADEPPAPSEWVPPPTVIDPPVKPTAKPKPVPASYTPPPSTTDWLKTTPLKVTPLNPSPLNFTPVKPFEPPVYKNPVFKPPEWVPPTFKAPVAAEIKWDKSVGYPGGDDNLAFSFNEMKGKVSTDLSQWSAWLTKQNVARLNDLAIAGGYPTLAAALADATNLKRQASDLGFRNYAFGPPAFSGSVSIQFGRDQLNLAAAQVLLGDALNAGKFGDPLKSLRESAVGDRNGLDRLLAQPFNVVLTWGAGAYDLDLHMTGPQGDGAERFHIYYAAPGTLTGQPFAQLIKDCICNSGSEVILTSALNSGGKYRISVFNFGDQSATSSNLSVSSNARIQIVRGGTTQSVGNGTTIIGGRVIVSASVPTIGAGNTWVAAELDPRNGRITTPGIIKQSPGSGGVE